MPYLGCIFQAENKFGGVSFGEITNRQVWGCYLEGKLQDIDFDQISHTWLKFWIFVTVIGCIFEWPVNFVESFSQKLINFRL